MIFLANIIGVIAFIIFILSFQIKDRKKLLFYQMIANIFYSIQYALLNAFGAASLNIISSIRCLVFNKFKTKIPFYILLIFILLIIGTLLYSYNGLISLLPVIISLIYVITSYGNNMLIIRIGFLISAILWIIFNLNVGAYTSLIGNTFEIVSSLIAIFRHRKKTY